MSAVFTEGRTVLLFIAAWYEPCAQISQVLRALANDHPTFRFVQVRACVFVARGKAAQCKWKFPDSSLTRTPFSPILSPAAAFRSMPSRYPRFPLSIR